MAYPAYECRPLPLHHKPEEEAQPLLVLDAFFDFASIHEARKLLSEWLIAALAVQDGCQLDYIHLYHEVERLLEACWLLCDSFHDEEQAKSVQMKKDPLS